MALRNRIKLIVQIIVMVLMALVVLSPLAMMFAGSFKADEFQIQLDMGGLRAFWVDSPSLENYRQILSDDQSPFLRFLFNSVLIVFSIVFIGIFVNSACAYSLARLQFKGQKLLLGSIIALIIIPVEALAVPLLLMVNKLGWIDSYHVQIVPFIAHPFSIFLFYQFFLQLPKEIDEAAVLDGATPWYIYWKIVLPLSLPVIATVAILQSLEYWNSFLWPLMVTRGPEYRPISLALAQFFGLQPRYWGDIMAFSVLMSLPILIIYFSFQRWFIQSVAGSAVKG